MSNAPVSLIGDFLEWLERAPRSYGDTMEAWRTSCPRLTVWEDACDQALVHRQLSDGTIVVTDRGRALLAARRP